ncbi:hypothetical protein ARMGADRAFT_1161916 [Armillaria gallica]|uniref:Uncharacterized protein n=1 Tax=Armillaria gallica TaxID=47427 RepID=A0A2H3EDT0_ARMGA|nr:hypothetical protein ARMGADRAFT_1161916 [Armillaria gallica]
MTTLPPELVEIIVHDIRNSEMPSFVRKSSMTTCPRIKRTWNTVHMVPIASQDIYITNLGACLLSMRHIPGRKIYHLLRLYPPAYPYHYLLRVHGKAVYRYLVDLPKIRGFEALFKNVRCISFQIVWMGMEKDIIPVLSLHGIPVRVPYKWFSPSTASPHHYSGKTRMRIDISVKDQVFWGTNTTYWLHTTPKVRNVGVPRYLFTTEVPESHREAEYQSALVDGFQVATQYGTQIQVSCQSLLRLGMQTPAVIFARSESLYQEAYTLKVDPPREEEFALKECYASSMTHGGTSQLANAGDAKTLVIPLANTSAVTLDQV